MTHRTWLLFFVSFFIGFFVMYFFTSAPRIIYVNQPVLSPPSDISYPTLTSAEIKKLKPVAFGQFILCSNCVNGPVCKTGSGWETVDGKKCE